MDKHRDNALACGKQQGEEGGEVHKSELVPLFGWKVNERNRRALDQTEEPPAIRNPGKAVGQHGREGETTTADWEGVAALGYEAYAKEQARRGKRTTAWDDLPEYERVAWIEAAKEIARVYAIAVCGP